MKGIKVPIPTMDDFLTVRHGGIGGSDAAAVLGLSPYMSKVDLYNIKTKPPVLEQINNELFQFGHDSEGPLVRLFEIQNKLVSEDTKGFTLLHEQYDFIRVNLDGFVESENAVLEIKTVNRNFDGWKNGKIPDNYYIQLLHEMYGSGADAAYMYALLNTNYTDSPLQGQLYQYRLERKDVESEIEMLIKAEVEFWTKHIEPRNRPLSSTEI